MINKEKLRQIIKENTTEQPTFKWSRSGLSMVMYVNGQEAMSFSTQKEVRDLIVQLEELLEGPMRTAR